MTKLKWPFLVSFSKVLQVVLMLSLSTLPANPVLALDNFLYILAGLNCATDQIAKFDGTKWVCAADEVGPDNDTLAGLNCAADQIAKFDGTEWVCAADEDTPAQGQRPDPPCFSDGVTDPVFNGVGRYFDCRNGTVADTVTGLTLLQNANCFGQQNWKEANESAASLGDGQCGLTDGSSPGDWRLPTTEEWSATIAQARTNLCVETFAPSMTDRGGEGCIANDPLPVFSGVQSNYYWSSITGIRERAFSVDLVQASRGLDDKTNGHFVWPVRGGQ